MIIHKMPKVTALLTNYDPMAPERTEHVTYDPRAKDEACRIIENQLRDNVGTKALVCGRTAYLSLVAYLAHSSDAGWVRVDSMHLVVGPMDRTPAFMNVPVLYGGGAMFASEIIAACGMEGIT